MICEMLHYDGWGNVHWYAGNGARSGFSLFVGSIAAECRRRGDLRWTTDECYLS